MAQNIIVTKAGERFEAIILGEDEAEIELMLFNSNDSTIYLLSKEDIETITYQEKKTEDFEEVLPQSNIEIITPEDDVVMELPVAKQTSERIRKNILRINPLTTILGAVLGGFEVELQYAGYFHPKVGVPILIDIASFSGIFGFAIMAGIEAVPLTHRQKSGLFINALAGVMGINDTEIGFVCNANLGYQLVSKGGFVLTGALGPEYNTITNTFRAKIMLAFGFGF
jgi:hypothetical protein